MAFIKFEGAGKKASLFISITKSKSFGFGGDFLEANDLLAYKYVTLFFDPEELQIGFKFSHDKESNATYSLVENQGTASKNVVARSFFREFLPDEQYNLDFYISKYRPKKITDSVHGDLFVIKLERKDTAAF